jgi:hypothetical protein
MSPNALQLGIENDYVIFDNLETVTYFRRVSNSGFDAGTVVAGALREVGMRTEVQRAGSLVKQTLGFNLPTVLVGDFANPVAPLGVSDPKVNDVIQDAAGVRWSVIETDNATLQTRWYCRTVQERI